MRLWRHIGKHGRDWKEGDEGQVEQVIRSSNCHQAGKIFFFLIKKIFFHYSWFAVFCQSSTVQQGDPLTHTHTCSFFSHYHAPS